ncbi:NAD-dependent epimerase/dehydratase family protein [Actinopolymorpha rutila]|uniref:UDP-glucose 4-epimerase n=1 Tax=Actinopolymorpha rutila TaxID=446787 RepID=A0A852ZV78_9ACTN|nr:NAD-dependent epimerase/dehydratase family protein [Actinopolymorpha rutila]NYH92616.1 UDP-glucose 4-epimerase [Actinopolymorpha rutila]
MARVVLVTGVSRDLGSRFARRLAGDPGVDRVLAVDVVPPRHDLGDAEFVRVDLRSPVVSRVLARESIDTVVHLNVIATPQHAGGRATMKEINVIGTMQLLAACQRLPSVSKVVVKSSTAVYGASPADPAMFTEDMEPRALPQSGFAKDAVEVESYVRGFARRRPDVAVTTLRFANVIGQRVRTPMTRYFTLPVVPTVLGFDARLQFVHEDDLLEALRLATVSQVPGTFNVAGDGMLMLSQAIRRMGRPTAPVPAFAVATFGQMFRAARLADFTPEQLSYLTYGRGVDTTRMRDDLGFKPSHTTAEAFESFAAVHEQGLLSSDRVAAAEEEAAAFLGIRDVRDEAEGVRQGHG